MRTRVEIVTRGAVLGLCFAFLGGTGTAAAQEGETGTEVEEPSMPGAPVQFRVGASISSFDWSGISEGGTEVEDVLMFGAELESVLFRYASIRLGTSFGQPWVRSTERSVDVNQFLVDLTLVGRLAAGPWTRIGLVPYALASFGSVVHAPRDDPDLIAKNQNTYSFGGGLEWIGFRRFGVRVEWREGEVDHDNIFDPQDRESVDRDLRRITGQIFWVF